MFTVDTRPGFDLHPSYRGGEGQVQTVQVRAFRDITTEIGFIKKGEVGLVPKSWVNKVIAGGCGCKGSPNWFRII